MNLFVDEIILCTTKCHLEFDWKGLQVIKNKAAGGWWAGFNLLGWRRIVLFL